jgi:fumarate reductase flavoprotein subunit
MTSEGKTKTENLKADIVIIGGGGAGLAAAVAAAEKGCKSIIVLEKTGSPAGSTAMAHDIFGAESPVQKRAGVDARTDDLFKIAMEWAHWTKINPRLMRAFIDKSGDTIRWLEEKGLEFAIAQFFPGQVPWVRHYIVKGQGAQLMKTLRNNCHDFGVKVLTHARGQKIIRGEKGNVTGVVAATKEGELTITTKSVIITTGGYGNNKGMLKEYCPYYHDTMTYDGPPSNTGDGIVMATEIGAATAGLGALNLHGPFLSRRESLAMTVDAKGHDGAPLRVRLSELAWEPYTIWVNKNGRRFVDEAYNLAFFAFGNTVALQPDGISYTLFDSKTMQMMEKQGLFRSGIFGIHTLHGFVSPAIPLPGLEREVRGKEAEEVNLKISDSWNEIAKWMGAEPAVLKATIDEYNAACEQGHDALFVKDPKYLLPLRSAPYYAIRGHVAICDAYGGIKINENMEALDTDDNTIPGLYAAGSTAGCWESESYCYHLTGHLVGFALNSGRIAGENAVAYLSK